MAELEISIINSTNDSAKELQSVLGNFDERHRAKVNYTLYIWETAWAEIMKIMLYKHGPGMSQVGTTWLGSLESTQALRPFTPAQIKQVGGADVYHSATWKSGISIETGQIVAIPWFVDTYVLYYRKDILQKAGIDETSAFKSLDALAETVQKLYQAGITIPFAMPNGIPSRSNLHNVAGWIWNYGGDFISENGKQLLLSNPKTRDGLRAYFSFVRWMPKAAQILSDADCYRVFLDGSAAITLRNTSLLHEAQSNPFFKEHVPDMGVAAMPGINFVGGSSFVLWNHIGRQEEQLAVELLCEITTPETQLALFKENGLLPARIEALNALTTDPLYVPVVQTIMKGRAFHKTKLWGLIEDRLSIGFSQIWQTLYANENANIDEEIARVLDPLERRLQLTLSDG